jgi:hypothetical protein
MWVAFPKRKGTQDFARVHYQWSHGPPRPPIMGRPRNHLPSNEKFRLGSVEVPGLRRPGLRLLLRQQSPATFLG